MDQTLAPASAVPVADTTAPARRSWAKRTAITGFLVFAICAAFYLLPGVRQANEVCGRAPNLIAFELARSVAQINTVFAETTPGCRDAMAKAMNQMNRLDLPLFMSVYAIFMVSAALFESAKSRQRRWLWALLAAGVALLGDLIETGVLLQITDNLDDPGEYIGPLIVSTWIKWLALGIFAGLVAVLTLQQSPRRWVIGLVNLAAAALTVLALVAPATFGLWMSLALGAGWFVIWMDALRAVFLKR
jgi:hypothetical protein